MHKFKLIPLIFANCGNFIVRFFALLLKKKAQPSILVSDGLDVEEERYYTIYPKLSLVLKNGMILKINRTYIPLRRNEMHLTLNLVDFSGDYIHFKLIGVIQQCKVSVPIKNHHSVQLNLRDTNETMLFDDIQSKGVDEVSIKETELAIRLSVADMNLAFESIAMQPKEIKLVTSQVAIRLSLNEIEDELNAKNTLNVNL